MRIRAFDRFAYRRAPYYEKGEIIGIFTRKGMVTNTYDYDESGAVRPRIITGTT